MELKEYQQNTLKRVKAYLEAQDRKIAEASGNPRGAIKTVLPVGR